ISAGYFGFKLVGAMQHIFIEPRTIRDSAVVSNNPVTGTPIGGGGGQTVVGLGRYQLSHDVYSLGITVDVGEVAVRLKGALTGDKNWWKPQGAGDRKLLDAGRFLQQHSNF